MQTPAEQSANSRQDYEELAAAHVSMRRVFALFMPYRLKILAVVVLLIFGSMIGMAAPFLLRAIIDDALPGDDFSLLLWLVGGLVAVAILGAAISTVQTILSARIGQAILHDLRVRVYAHLQSLSLRFFAGNRTGEIQSRIAAAAA